MTTVTLTPLSEYEHDVLNAVTSSARSYDGQGWQAQATIVWVNADGWIEMGPVRSTTGTRDQDYFSASPFPGAWVAVHRSRIVKVQHGVPVPVHGDPEDVVIEQTVRVHVRASDAARHGLAPWNLTAGRPRV